MMGGFNQEIWDILYMLWIYMDSIGLNTCRLLDVKIFVWFVKVEVGGPKFNQNQIKSNLLELCIYIYIRIYIYIYICLWVLG